MIKFALGRLLQAIPVLLVVITATFFLVHSAPGGPFSADKAVPPEVIRALEAQYNLDQPLWQQYLSYLGDVLQALDFLSTNELLISIGRCSFLLIGVAANVGLELDAVELSLIDDEPPAFSPLLRIIISDLI